MKKKLTLLFALLCVSMMSWATQYCGRVVEATVGETAGQTLTFTASRTGTLETTFILTSSTSTLTTFYAIDVRNAAGDGVTSTNWNEWESSGGTLTKVVTWTTYPSKFFDIYLVAHRSGAGTDIIGATFTSVDVSAVCSSCTDETKPSISAVDVSDVTSNSAVLTITASDPVEEGSGIASYVVKNNGSQIASSSSNVITLTGLTASTLYDDLTVNVVDNCGNTSDAFDVDEFTTLARPSQCEGDLGHFATWSTKRVHYTIEYLPTVEKIRYEVSGYGTQVLDYLEINTTSGNSGSVPIVNGVAVWKQTAPAAGTEMGIQFVFSTDAIGGNEINAENTTSFTGNNEHLVYYKSRDCEAAVEPATAPTTTPDESTIFNDCQIYSILGSDYYMSAGFNNETNAWGGGTATTENIDGRDVLHIANSNYLERGFNAHDVSGYTHIHFDVWTAETMNLGMKLMAYEEGWREGDRQNFTTSAGAWKSIDLALSGFNHGYLNKIQGIYPLDMQQENIYFTNIYFYKTADDVACYGTLNLAERKPSEAGYEDGNPDETAAAANDGLEGDDGHGWVTWNNRPAAEEWWYVDLKNNYEISKIEILWGSDYSTEYILQTRTEAPSNADKADDAAWVTIATVTDAAANATKINTFTTATGRYVRFRSITRSSAACIRMREFRVFGNGYAITDVNNPVITTAEVADDSENETSVKLHLVATDVEDDVVKTFLLNKGDDSWLPISTDASDTYTVSDLARGHYSYQVKARDHAGNVSEISTINFDIFNPADNLALNKPVVAGYTPENQGEVPAKANDGNLGTPWTTYNDRPMEEQWWSVDLGDVYQLSAVDLFWDVRSNHYLIQVAQTEPSDRSDDTQWFTALEVDEVQTTGNAEENKNHYALNVPARYVRFKAITKEGTFLKLWEFRVFGSAYATEDTNAPEITSASVTYGEGNAYLTLQATDTEDGVIKTFRVVNTTTDDKAVYTTDGEDKIVIAGLDINTPYDFEIQAMDKAANLSSVTPLLVRLPATAGNLALGKTCYAGYEWTNEGEKKEKANDGDTGTNWVTYGGEENRDGWWWYVDLGSLYHLTSVELYWPDVYFSNNYKIQVRREAPSEEQKADDNAWTTVATVTDAAAEAAKTSEVDVVARYVRVKILNTGWIKLAEVRVFGDAVVVALDDQVDNTATIAANDEAQANVEFNRTFDYANEWYTICLPFDMTNAQLVDAFGAGYTLAELVGSDDRGSIIHINFDYVRALVAGKAYLVKVASPITEAPTFRNVTIKDVNPASLKSTCPHMEFQGTFAAFTLEGENKRFVGEENYLYAPNPDGGTPMGAFRCYFTIPDGSSAGAPGRTARLNFAPEQTTEIGNVGEQATPSKYILNGVLYIIRDGRTYNAQGMLVQ
jgi:hypothetical protein